MTARPSWPPDLADFDAWFAEWTAGQPVDAHMLAEGTRQWHARRQAWATEHGYQVRSDGRLVVDAAAIIRRFTL